MTSGKKQSTLLGSVTIVLHCIFDRR